MDKNKKFTKEKMLLFLAAFVIFLIVMAVFLNQSHHKKEKIEETLIIYMEYPDEYPDYTVLNIEDGIYHPISVKKHEKSGEEGIKVVNGDKEIKSIEILLEKDNVIVSRIIQQMDEERYFFELADYEEGEYNIYLMVEKQDGYVYYVSSGTTFLEAVSDEKIKGSTLEMLRDIDVDIENLESITIRNPFQWETKGYSLRSKLDLNFVSDEAGKMLIHNNSESDIDVGRIFCDTPQWEYEITQVFDEFKEEKFCYINAKSLNEKQIDTSLVYIDSQDKLNHIIKNGKLNLLTDTYKVVFDGSLDIESVYIDRAVELYFCGTVNVSNGIIFSVKGERKNGTILVNTQDNSISITKKIEFDTPEFDVSWVGSDSPEYEYMQQYMNIKSYNGQTMDNNLGGLGTTKLLSGTIYDREDTDKKFDFVTEGNYINIELGYVNTLDMSNAIISANMDEEGTASISEKDGQYYCNISDANGNTRGYKINMQYKEYNLPIVYISTNNGLAITSKDEYVDGQISLNYPQDSSYENLNSVSMKIRGRGHSSWELDKKPYKIKFNKKTSLFGLKEAKEWVLVANHIDRSLMRNNVAMSMGSLLDNMVFVPHSYMVDVFVNGQYQGVYNISEHIEMKQGRIEGENDSVEVNTDYLLEFGGEGKKTGFGDNVFSTTLCNYVEVKTPDEEILTEEQFNYIKDYFQKVDDSVMNLSGYEEYLDIESLIDWFILHEFSYNTDCSFRRSVFLLKKKDGKLFMASPWDFDYAFGNMSMDSDAYSEWICLGNSKTDAYDEYIKTNWMDYLLKDSNFKKQLKNRWNEVGLSLYNKAMETIDENEKLIGPSAEENFKLWNCLGVKLQYEKWATANIETYEEQVQYLRNFISNRYKWMDATINSFE